MKTKGQKLADKISYILNPDILIPVVMVIGFWYSNITLVNKIYAIVGIFFFNYIILLYWRGLLLKIGIVIDDKLSNRRVQRIRVVALMPEFLIYLAETLLIAELGAKQPLFAIMISLIILAVVSGIISIFWKISAHAEGYTFMVAILGFLFSPVYWFLMAGIPLVWWARLKLERHTPTQLAMGTLFPPIIAFLVFQYFGLL
ncbi:MAG: hypothetical protein CEN89_577 [Candidatus Berkelbacteria bacterium Licking1014_7]|uniref:Uncharacterized protein n=1 Tax=Candidatus Berkelbacteria bacterium Licking1014_7 TaxID=2017147 RepID=A0A554LIF9_9BACT|nr:MAG: hypothetical protein CEN89_577 [Candidatus Berkelbacteria bacterium Licking1014_7]